ncbi:hypothetical protein GGI42DRAFT_310727 [Trichoderma sp. SZMC 28013]
MRSQPKHLAFYYFTCIFVIERQVSLEMALPRWPPQFYIFCLIPLVHAYTVFETNCSAPVTQPNYVSSPNTRGTLEILFSCLFTIFACTWTLQHPNVPQQRVEDDPDLEEEEYRGPRDFVALLCAKWRKVKGRFVKWRKPKQGNTSWRSGAFYRSTLRMLSTILAPELIIAVASEERRRARITLLEMKKHFESKEEDKVAWSLTHSYYANMGGFVIRLRGQPNGKIQVPATHFSYHNPYHLNGKDILSLRKSGYISKLPDIREEEIKDKFKGDYLAKGIALCQIGWSSVQIAVRHTKNLSISPLEVAVVAYSLCAVFTYLTYWHKPQRINVAHAIQLDAHAIRPDTQQTEAPPQGKDTMSDEVFQILQRHDTHRFFGSMLGSQTAPMGAPISMDSTPRGGLWTPYIVALFAAVFGGIHFIAWNFSFPSTVELMLWRWLSVYLTAAPFFAWLLVFVDSKFGFSYSYPGPLNLGLLSRHSYQHRLFMGALYLLVALYFIGRLFILIEMFRTLFFLPPTSYISTWTSNAPHVA